MEVFVKLVRDGVRCAEDSPLVVLIGLVVLLPDDEDGECPAFDESALEDGFDLSIEEFSEVQDLILADPIHEIDLDDDWSPLKS